MEITREDFKKLNQLDRIEFRQIWFDTQKIRKEAKLEFSSELKDLVILLFFMGIFMLQLSILMGIESALPLIKEMRDVSTIFIGIYLGIIIFMYIKDYLFYKAECKRIEEQYFKINIKNKK